MWRIITFHINVLLYSWKTHEAAMTATYTALMTMDGTWVGIKWCHPLAPWHWALPTHAAGEQQSLRSVTSANGLFFTSVTLDRHLCCHEVVTISVIIGNRNLGPLQWWEQKSKNVTVKRSRWCKALLAAPLLLLVHLYCTAPAKPHHVHAVCIHMRYILTRKTRYAPLWLDGRSVWWHKRENANAPVTQPVNLHTHEATGTHCVLVYKSVGSVAVTTGPMPPGQVPNVIGLSSFRSSS